MTHPDLVDVEAAIADLTGRDSLLPRLRALITHQGTALESTIGSHTKHPAPPIPWNEPAALLYLDIHAGARQHEDNLTYLLFGHRAVRGGSDRHTVKALHRIPILLKHAAEQGHGDHHLARRAARDVTDWPVQVRRVLDESRPSEVPWTRAPGGLRCPHCRSVLQLPPGWQYAAERTDVVCRNRECRDDDGRERRWAASAWLAMLTDLDESVGELVTAPEGARRLGLDRNTVWVWRNRGKIAPVGRDGKGRDVYRLDDIRALAGQPAGVDDDGKVTA